MQLEFGIMARNLKRVVEDQNVVVACKDGRQLKPIHTSKSQ